jgi:hypothetical protein
VAEFEVLGPFEVPCEDNPAYRFISAESGAELWEDHPEICDRNGCYVFGVHNARGTTPIYVGQATRSYKKEVFQSHKLVKYAKCLSHYQKGTPVLFFVSEIPHRGRSNAKAIDELESYLIQAALAVNAELLNEKKTAIEPWLIRGVLRSPPGARSKAAQEFTACMKIS